MERTEALKTTLLELKSGGKIHIKKENRGKFTSYCGGKVTSECIARGKNSPNPAIRKRATFAANVRRGKHQEGGLIYKPFIPEEVTEHENTQATPLIYNQQDQANFPVEPVYIYKPMELKGERPEVASALDPTPEIIHVQNASNENINHINNALRKAGYNKVQRAAILATVVEESRGNPLAIGDSGKAKGIFQGHPNRFTAGRDLESQIQLMLYELKKFDNSDIGTSSKKYTKKDAYDTFHNTEDLNEAISALTANYIRPANTDNAIQKRYAIAQQLITQMS